MLKIAAGNWLVNSSSRLYKDFKLLYQWILPQSYDFVDFFVNRDFFPLDLGIYWFDHLHLVFQILIDRLTRVFELLGDCFWLLLFTIIIINPFKFDIFDALGKAIGQSYFIAFDFLFYQLVATLLQLALL